MSNFFHFLAEYHLSIDILFEIYQLITIVIIQVIYLNFLCILTILYQVAIAIAADSSKIKELLYLSYLFFHGIHWNLIAFILVIIILGVSSYYYCCQSHPLHLFNFWERAVFEYIHKIQIPILVVDLLALKYFVACIHYLIFLFQADLAVQIKLSINVLRQIDFLFICYPLLHFLKKRIILIFLLLYECFITHLLILLFLLSLLSYWKDKFISLFLLLLLLPFFIIICELNLIEMASIFLSLMQKEGITCLDTLSWIIKFILIMFMITIDYHLLMFLFHALL